MALTAGYPRRVLICEDEPEVSFFLEGAFRRLGFEVSHAATCVRPETPGECSLRCCDGVAAPDLVVVAVLNGRRCSGPQAAKKALERWSGVKILLISASPSCAWPRSVLSAFDVLPAESCALLAKPFKIEDLRSRVQQLLD